jgi:hypothetical protein
MGPNRCRGRPGPRPPAFPDVGGAVAGLCTAAPDVGTGSPGDFFEVLCVLPRRRNDNPVVSTRLMLGPIDGRAAGPPHWSESFHEYHFPEEIAVLPLFRSRSHRHALKSAESRPRRPRRAPLGLEALEGRQLLSLSGNEFLVNTTTRNAQFFSDNASSASGLSVAVWGDQSSTTHTDNDIRAQMYTAFGSRLGPELSIELGLANQENPHVAMDAFGNSVVVYEETNNGQRDLIARRVTLNPSTGLPQVGGRIVVVNGVKDEFDPDVAMDSKGNFVVSYTEQFSSTDRDIRAVRFDQFGNKIGFVINTARTTQLDETRSSVAMTPDGRFDIAYQSGAHGGGNGELHLARYSAAGGLLSDQPLFFGSFGSNPSVAMDSAGSAVVVFQATQTGGDHSIFPTNLNDIIAARYDTNGQLVDTFSVTFSGIAFRDTAPVNNVLPSVALSPSGGAFVVAYDTNLLGVPGNKTVEVSEVNAANNIVGVANLPAVPNNFAPALSIAGNGEYLLTFDAGVGGGADRNIHGRFGNLPVAPSAKDLKLPRTIQAGQSANLSGQLVDGNGDKKLTLTVNWGDGSKQQESKPGTKPFALSHKYTKAGTYKVRATWTDSTGLSNSRDLTLVVTPHHKK